MGNVAVVSDSDVEEDVKGEVNKDVVVGEEDGEFGGE